MTSTSLEWYRANREASLERMRARARSRQRFLNGVKLGSGCVDCGFADHPAALDLDHVRGEKAMDLSRARLSSWVVFIEELEKCDVRCANCHRIVTAERREA